MAVAFRAGEDAIARASLLPSTRDWGERRNGAVYAGLRRETLPEVDPNPDSLLDFWTVHVYCQATAFTPPTAKLVHRHVQWHLGSVGTSIKISVALSLAGSAPVVEPISKLRVGRDPCSPTQGHQDAWAQYSP